ncbi:MAG TPA: FimV/HubP family polar landmark protein, partial [Ottowia sp.]|nr:FimV/HubP family polar landmark protein [Ottowia sp.]
APAPAPAPTMADAASAVPAAPASAAMAEPATVPASGVSETVTAPVAAPAPQAAPVPPTTASEGPSFLDALTDNPLLPIAGAGLIALLAGFGVYRWRQSKKGDATMDSSFIESRLQPDSFFGASGGQRVDTREGRPSVGSSSSMVYSPSQLDAAGDVDPVAEADVYLAYGRDMQAEEILKEALRTHPGRVSVHRKLAEIYARRRDARAIEMVASEAWNHVKGEGADWAAIASLGSELDPDNPLYKPGGVPMMRSAATATTPQPRFGADTEPQTAQLQDKRDSKPDSSSIPLDLELDLDDAPVRANAVTSVPPSVGNTSAMPNHHGPEPAIAAAPEVKPVPIALPDFDLDLDTPTTVAPALAAAVATQADDEPPSVAQPYVASKAGMIDFDMEALSIDPDSRSGVDPKTEQPDDADDDPVATKLALAQEFHAIGDTEGARTLVREVIAEATGSLRMRAERFLAELD